MSSAALDTPCRSLAVLRAELLAEQRALTARHYAALLELQTVRDELAAVERRLQAIDAAVAP